ncbi:hypothetical protein ACPPTR_19480 [Ralstonia pseudosolanacearum]|uniref:Uncharacterized protein n=1 Tax=Ralstonia solanacearum TaxID=305 RepID=A0A0S4X1N1_RALSL|nr:hypothetical protein [Ralstonia pseudosolanacearum]OIN70514.1 hypothetical protein BL248_19355 [Ralstonia solanacearum]MCD9228591.1 hypothetical protein [Ralstonia pseudosolanacearum]MCK4164747.1 hypothetical protein [Ralstonia pseudosolanacearum]MDO3559168.1 hypothetical protein [Ralstonia pseudosolanacearum]MDO3578768.1 hypothetical protein [Ralstonia pseudosolanacearum]
MLYEKLPNVGPYVTNGFDLRVDAARAISAVEIQAGYGASGQGSAQALRDFFVACANACNAVAPAADAAKTVKLA